MRALKIRHAASIIVSGRPSCFVSCFLLCLSAFGCTAEKNSPPEPAKNRQPPNVVLITLDTTRADHIGSYGYKNARTPNLDGLALRGVRFDDAFTCAPITLAAHTCILTGVYPFSTGVRDNGLYALPKDTSTLATALRNQGYNTTAYVSAAVLDRVFGLDQGFDVYDDYFGSSSAPSKVYPERSARSATHAVKRRISEVRPPYFLWIHYFDPHSPYEPQPPYDDANTPYDGEIAATDAAIGELLALLEHDQLLENTLIVVVGDHGESLGDHGENTHGVFVYDSVMRVPLIMAFEGVIAPGKVLKGLVRTVDIFPTVLDYAGVSPNSLIAGESIRSSIEKGALSISEAYEESEVPFNEFGWSPIYSLRTNEWHFILSPRAELYNITRDPQEKENLFSTAKMQAEHLRVQLTKNYDFRKHSSEGNTPDVSPELREQLEALGYVSSSAASPKDSLIDPKDGIGMAIRIDEAIDLANRGNFDKSIQILKGVVKENPDNTVALMTLGNTYLRSRQYSEAQTSFQKALTRYKLDYAYLGLGDSLAAQEEHAAARDSYKAAIALNRRFAPAYLSWARMELSLKNLPAASTILDDALSQDLLDPQILLLRGQLHANNGEIPKAITFFQKAIAQDPGFIQAYNDLGAALYAAGSLNEAIDAYRKSHTLNASDPTVLRTLGAMYLYDKKDPARALDYFRKALRVTPPGDDAEALKAMISELSK